MKTNTLLILSLTLLALPLRAQDYYQKTFSNATYTDVHKLPSGEILLTGQLAKMIPGSAIIQKLSATGSLISSEQITAAGGSGLNFFGGMPNHTITMDGDNVLLSVYSSGFTGNTSIYPGLIKMNAAGDVLWNKVYKNDAVPGPTNARGGLTSTIIDNGNYVSSGWFNSGSGGAFDYFNMLQKTDADGNVIWRKDFGYAFIFASDVTKTANGNYIVLGGQSGGTYIYVFDNNGNYISHSRYGIGTVYPVANQILNTADGGYLVLGTVANTDGYVLKLDANYALQWSKRYNEGTRAEVFNKVIATTDGGYLIAGETRATTAANADGLLVKIDAAGAVLWSRTYGRATDDGIFGLEATQNGYLAVGGSGTDGWVIHTDLNGLADGCDEFAASITALDVTTTPTAMAALTPMSTTGVLNESVTKTAYASNQVLPYAIEINAESTALCSGELLKLELAAPLATALWTSNGEGEIYTDEEGTIVYDGTSKLHTVYVAPVATQTYTATACLLTDSVEIIVSTATAPTGDAQQAFCQNATLEDVDVEGEAIIWYDAETDGTVLPVSTSLENNKTYYAAQTNACGESPRLAITITITIAAAPQGESIQSSCVVDVLNDIVVTGENITWYDALTNGNILPGTTEAVNETIYYASQTINGCESTNRLAVTIDACLSVPGYEIANLNLYPNPVVNLITIDSAISLDTISLISVTGQLLKTISVSGTSVQVSMEGMSSGVYFMRVNSGSQNATYKIVKL